MKVQSILSRYFLVLMMTSIAMTGCFNEQAYRKLEDSYSRPTKQVSPMSSNVRWACESNMLFEPAKIKIIYASMRRVAGTCTKEPFSFDVGENLRNKQWFRPDLPGNTHLTEICKYPKIPIKDCQPTDTLKVPNTDPNKGAVNVWQVSSVSLDGVLSENKVTNLRGSERIHYAMYIVEGHKLPLGGMFRGRFSQDYMDNQNKRTVKSTFTTANGLEWEHARYNRRPKESDQPNWLYDQTEMYQADVGNYSILIYGIYNDPVYKYPDWLAKRQAFLREWIETFKIEPLPAGYKKVQ
jgi:hypothetical protein